VQTLQSYWFIKSDHLGKVGIGLQSMVSDNLAILVDGSGSLVPANWVSFDVGGFRYRTSGGGVSSSSIIGAGGCNGGGDCYGVPVNSVRYDSPTFAGFSLSAAWGEDDVWDIGGRYAGEMHGFKLAAAVGYGEVTGGNVFPQGFLTGLEGATGGSAVSLFAPDSSYFQVGAYAQHIATGLFLLVNYGDLDVDGAANSETWYFKGGVRTKCLPFGATVFYGEYDKNEDGAGAGSESQWWGLGVVQEVDAAAMSLWLSYRQFSADEATGDATPENLEDFDMIKFGALINF
jgi:predicted porin